jgi:predicted metalloendopeptidase
MAMQKKPIKKVIFPLIIKAMIKTDFYHATNRKFMDNVDFVHGSNRFSFAMQIQNDIFNKMRTIRFNRMSPYLTTRYSKMRSVKELDETSCIFRVIEGITKMTDASDIPGVLFNLNSFGCTPFFRLQSCSNICNPGREMICLDVSREITNGLTDACITTMWKKFRLEELQCPTVKQIAKFEKQIFKHVQPSNDKPEIEMTHNAVDRVDLPSWLISYFGHLSKKPSRISLDYPKLYHGVQKSLINNTKLRQWQYYLLVHWLLHISPLLKDTYQLISYEGVVKREIDHKVRIAAVSWWQDAGMQYVSEHVDPVVKNVAFQLFKDIQTTMIQIVEECRLDNPTKLEALAKITKMRVHLGWADKKSDLFLQPSRVHNSTHLSQSFDVNFLIGCKYQWSNVLLQSQRKTNYKQWRGFGYHIANAWYIPEYNTMYIPASLFASPYLDIQDVLSSYPCIGVIIAHEMSHAMDCSGKNIDSTGKLRQWWTLRDSKNYDKNSRIAIRLYSNYHKNKKQKVDGRLTLSENIADILALRVAWIAFIHRWRITNQKKNVPISVQKSFFSKLAFCRTFKTTPEEQRKQLEQDPHAPPADRTNITLSQFDPFYKLYGIQKGDGMFRPIKDRPRFFM